MPAENPRLLLAAEEPAPGASENLKASPPTLDDRLMVGLWKWKDAAEVNRARLLVPAAVRYSCRACGRSCRGFSVELTETDAQRILSTDWSALGLDPEADLVEELWVEDQQEKTWLLRRVDGRCVFLGEDHLCGIHKVLGYEAKPFPCRLFPYEFIATPEGLLVSVRSACYQTHLSQETGEPLPEQHEHLQRLAAECPRFKAVPDFVPLREPHALWFAQYRQCEAMLLHHLHRAATPEAGLGAVAQVIAESVAQSDEELAARQGQPAPPTVAPPTEDERLCHPTFRALLRTWQERGQALRRRGRQEMAEDPDRRLWVREEAAESLEITTAALLERLGEPAPPDPDVPVIRVDPAALDRLAPDPPQVVAYFHTFLLQYVAQKSLLDFPDLVTGAGSLVLLYLMIRWGARVAALRQGETAVTLPTVNRSLVEWTYLLRTREFKLPLVRDHRAEVERFLRQIDADLLTRHLALPLALS
jgi:Fe-S-cluster containining protein